MASFYLVITTHFTAYNSFESDEITNKTLLNYNMVIDKDTKIIQQLNWKCMGLSKCCKRQTGSLRVLSQKIP